MLVSVRWTIEQAGSFCWADWRCNRGKPWCCWSCTTVSILTVIKCIWSSKRRHLITRLHGYTCQAQSASHRCGSDQTFWCVWARGALTRLTRCTPSPYLMFPSILFGKSMWDIGKRNYELTHPCSRLAVFARVGALSYAERQSLPIVTVQGRMIASEENLQTTQTQAYWVKLC